MLQNTSQTNECIILTIGTYTSLLRELVAEFTLTDNPANTTTSQLRALCHVDDSVILGSWLQETDHKAVEDQVNVIFNSLPNNKFLGWFKLKTFADDKTNVT